MAGLRFVSLNIERSKHLDLVIPFLRTCNADIVCIQELFERDIPRFEAELGGTMHYEPMGMHPADAPEEGTLLEGMGILTRVPVVSKRTLHYRPETNGGDSLQGDMNRRPILFIDIDHEGGRYTVGTTHFTWTPDGRPTDEQREDLVRLMHELETETSFVLSGDFNAPRGGEIFTQIAARYTDNIPSHYDWSLDLEKHRSGGGKIQTDAASYGMKGFVVDGLFSTSDYAVTDVSLESGVSDHCAVVAHIERRS